MLDESLITTAQTVLDSAPCSIEIPAGGGKTHLLAAAVAVASLEGTRSLILTHTNAGVDVLRSRMKKFGIKPSTYHIDTIMGWAFTIVRAYGEIAETTVAETPDWSKSVEYLDAAIRVSKSTSIALMYNSSFGYFFIDEYQDCMKKQHEFIEAIADNISRTIILGDRLQGIFSFRGEALADWDSDVFPRFPLCSILYQPYRWRDTNPVLGQWLMDMRPNFVDGATIDFSSVTVDGFKWVKSDIRAVTNEAYRLAKLDESVVILDKWPASVAWYASRLNGLYSMMEEIEGSFMLKALETLPANGDHLLAAWLADFAKSCAIGLSGINKPILAALNKNLSITHYKRVGLEQVLTCLDQLRQTSSYEELLNVASIISHSKGLKIYRFEAWHDTICAIENCIQNDSSPIEEFAKVRDRIRKAGRKQHKHIASRTLLVKGLEYEHVIVADMTKMCDPKNLYVALTRASKSLTLIGPSPHIVLKNGS
ncbi:MAG: UvrD-helicase domain-containing protein [Christensenellales bacterium]